MKTIIVSSDIQGINFPAGGIATFVTHFSKLLRTAGYDVTILSSRGKVTQLDPLWWAYYQTHGINIVQINDPVSPVHTWGDLWSIRRSEEVAAHISDADIVYFQDWHANGFHTVRQKRFRLYQKPICVTVLHGCAAWLRQSMHRFPTIPDDLNLDFVEQYTANNSDFVVSPSQFMIDWVVANGWKLPPPERVRVLGLPIMDLPPIVDCPSPQKRYERIIFFGRLETRKGFEIFVEALCQIADQSPIYLKNITEVVLLGSDASHQFGTVESALAILRDKSIAAKHINQLNSSDAQQYLAENAHSSLVVMPNLSDNFPYAVIEASLIKNLNIICSEQGGIPEILGVKGKHQLFAPTVPSLVEHLKTWLKQEPTSNTNLGQYNHIRANKQWLSFHEQVSNHAQKQPPRKPLVNSKIDTPLLQSNEKHVDICIPYYNHGQYLPQLLQSLEHQTYQNFNVIIVDDGSTDPESHTIFSKMKSKYRGRKWRFIQQENAYLGAARNTAVKNGNAEYICFIDADDVAAPNTIKRFLEAIELSKVDCLASYKYLFKSNSLPVDFISQKTIVPPHQLYKPIGSSMVAGILMNVFGGAGIIIRRDVFNKIGGFTEERDLTGEDYELLAKLNLAGFKVDVIPEYLYYYRVTPNSMIRTTDRYSNTLRALRAYTDQMQALGLGTVPIAFHGLYQQFIELQAELNRLKQQQHNPEQPQQKTIEHKIMLLNQKLESQNWKIQHQLDIQQNQINRPPSPIQIIRGLYWFLVPTFIRLSLRNWRQKFLRR